MIVSVVVRTYNESKHLGDLLRMVGEQEIGDHQVEVVVVDSGSTDGTIEIAQNAGARLVRIAKDQFTFGRSLNLGCQNASGEILVIVSGHCVPVDRKWLSHLIAPIVAGECDYSYGRQLGGAETFFSEKQIFAKYFPAHADDAIGGYYCNNANSAISKAAWARLGFNEELTGLEDMDMARRLCEGGGKILYVPSSVVYHIHSETWAQVRRRFEREAIALRQIHPDVILGFRDFIRYSAAAVLGDLETAVRTRTFRGAFRSVMMYRCLQFWGSYKGHHMGRKVSSARKEKYYYPR